MAFWWFLGQIFQYFIAMAGDSANRLISVSEPSGMSTYALDLAAGLMQVLEDGTNQYFYGNGRIAQRDSGTLETEYFLGDVLGSVRQLADAAGEVMLEKDYDPYGNVLSSSGLASSMYGFDGEQTDSYLGLINLRSRLYYPYIGRFLTRDVWQGDYNEPLSLNRWNYVEGNPINLTDPRGNIPSKDDVNRGYAIFSCNCGWIDFGHANTQISKTLFDLLGEEATLFAQRGSEYRSDVFAISLNANLSFWNMGEMPVTSTVVVSSGLSDQEKNSVALGIFRSFEEQIEYKQGLAMEWFTYFSFEDLTSDDIGFYLALKYNKMAYYDGYINPYSPGAENEGAWRWLAGVCGFPENKQDAIDRSVSQYKAIVDSMDNSYVALILASLALNSNLHIYDWGSPLLCYSGGICDNDVNSWPSEFTTITPASPQRNGQWWFYEKNQDGDLRSSDSDPNFYFLK